MGKWALKMVIGVVVALGLTYVEGKMMNRLLWGDLKDKTKDEPKNQSQIEVTDYEVR